MKPIPRHRNMIRMVAVTLALAAAPGITFAQTTGEIVTQPATDVGIKKTETPALLEQISDDPYNTSGTGTCALISKSIKELSDILGPDYADPQPAPKRDVAKMGGAAIINSLIPFRGLVREVSGAAPAERRKNAAIAAGVARRGFLRGLQYARKCRR